MNYAYPGNFGRVSIFAEAVSVFLIQPEEFSLFFLCHLGKRLIFGMDGKRELLRHQSFSGGCEIDLYIPSFAGFQ